MDTRYHKLVSLTGMVSGIFDSGVRLAIRDDQGRGFPYPSHLNHRPLLNTPSPQHLSLPILGLISPPQSNRCCCLETRALRQHGKQDKLCADNFSILNIILFSCIHDICCISYKTTKLQNYTKVFMIYVTLATKLQNDKKKSIHDICCINYKTTKLQKSIHDICYSCMFRRCINGGGTCVPL